MDQETLTEMVKPSIDYMRHKRFRSGNYPSSLSNETDRLVHWCHGAPGVIHTLMQAYKVSAAGRVLSTRCAQTRFPPPSFQFAFGRHICLQTKSILELIFLLVNRKSFYFTVHRHYNQSCKYMCVFYQGLYSCVKENLDDVSVNIQ